MASPNPPTISPISRQRQWDLIIAKRFGLWAALVAALLAVAGYYLLRGPYAEWRNLSAVRALQGQLQQYRNSLNSLSSEISDWQQLDVTSRGQLEIMLPGAADLPNLLTELEAVATQAGFQVQALGLGESNAAARSQDFATTASNVRQVQITLSLSGGSYTSFKRLLTATQRAWRVLQLDSFGVSAESDIYRLQLTAFYLPASN